MGFCIRAIMWCLVVRGCDCLPWLLLKVWPGMIVEFYLALGEKGCRNVGAGVHLCVES